MAQYQKDMALYEKQKAQWDLLSPAEQMARHKAAEESQLKRYTVGFFVIVAIIGGIVGYFARILGTTNLVILMCGTIIAGNVISRYLWFVAGRIFRGLFKGLLWFIGMGIIGFILSKTEIEILKEFLQEHQKIMIGISGLISLIIGPVFEILGKHHAYGGPIEPSKP